MPPTDRKIRVLVVDDSAVVRKATSDALSRDSEIEVVGVELDPIIAQEKISRPRPEPLLLG